MNRIGFPLVALLLCLAYGYRGDESTAVAVPRTVRPPVIASTRKERFPSPEQRVKIYMSNWYIPPCPDYEDGFVRYSYHTNVTAEKQSAWPSLLVHVATDVIGDNQSASVLQMQSTIAPDTAFFVDSETIRDCLDPDGSNPVYQDRIEFRKNMNMYCVDVAASVLTAVEHVNFESYGDIPTLMQFGDLKHSHFFGNVNVPLLKKFRSAAATPLSVDAVTSLSCYAGARSVLETIHNTNFFQPIVWKLASRRHFGALERVYQEDTAWDKKINMAVFRGQLTGSRDFFNKHLSDEENCLNLRRCRLVYTNANSTLIHARLTSTRNRLPSILNGVHLMGSAVTIRRLMEFKGIIMLEGNDVASGLKWALLSQSVVLMPIPKHTSWAMEELLVPWVHYIPLNENATDAAEKMQWVLDHDDVARRISERASLWMEDLVFHPDAAEEDRWIQEEIIRRYRKHFQHSS